MITPTLKSIFYLILSPILLILKEDLSNCVIPGNDRCFHKNKENYKFPEQIQTLEIRSFDCCHGIRKIIIVLLH